MCLVSAPKQAQVAPTPDPAVLRNPFLDGLSGIQRSQRLGVSALTIQRGTPTNAATVQRPSGYIPAQPAVSPTSIPPITIGGPGGMLG